MIYFSNDFTTILCVRKNNSYDYIIFFVASIKQQFFPERNKANRIN